MNAFLDQQYFDWLYSQVCPVRGRRSMLSYRELFHILFTKEVIWLIPNDDNRIEDGKDLRVEFLHDEFITLAPQDRLWMDLGCSFLEFLIGIARRCAFETDSDQKEWFWELMENLGLAEMDDRKKIDHDEVESILDRVIWRTYNYDGMGGLFPLEHAEQDQREVEIWYQLSAYILERM